MAVRSYMEESDLLRELWIALAEDGEVPVEWVESHVPDRDLARIWQAADSPAAIYCLGGIGIDRVTLVAALLACARLVTDLLPSDDSRPRAVLAVVDRWIAGHADVAEVRQAEDAAMEAWHTSSRAGDARVCGAITAVLGPASVISAKPSRRPPTRAVHALDCTAELVGRTRVATALRDTLPCPAFETVLAP